jgi:hypothetical protein
MFEAAMSWPTMDFRISKFCAVEAMLCNRSVMGTRDGSQVDVRCYAWSFLLGHGFCDGAG